MVNLDVAVTTEYQRIIVVKFICVNNASAAISAKSVANKSAITVKVSDEFPFSAYRLKCRLERYLFAELLQTALSRYRFLSQ